MPTRQANLSQVSRFQERFQERAHIYVPNICVSRFQERAHIYVRFQGKVSLS